MDICIYFTFFIKKNYICYFKDDVDEDEDDKDKERSMIKKMTMVSMMIMRMMMIMMAIFIILIFGLLGQNMSLDCVMLVWECK